MEGSSEEGMEQDMRDAESEGLRDGGREADICKKTSFLVMSHYGCSLPSGLEVIGDSHRDRRLREFIPSPLPKNREIKTT